MLFPIRQTGEIIPTRDPMLSSRKPCGHMEVQKAAAHLERVAENDSGAGRPALKGKIKGAKSVQLG